MVIFEVKIQMCIEELHSLKFKNAEVFNFGFALQIKHREIWEKEIKHL